LEARSGSQERKGHRWIAGCVVRLPDSALVACVPGNGPGPSDGGAQIGPADIARRRRWHAQCRETIAGQRVARQDTAPEAREPAPPLFRQHGSSSSSLFARGFGYRVQGVACAGKPRSENAVGFWVHVAALVLVGLFARRALPIVLGRPGSGGDSGQGPAKEVAARPGDRAACPRPPRRERFPIPGYGQELKVGLGPRSRFLGIGLPVVQVWR
jgi:hypothetical protein